MWAWAADALKGLVGRASREPNLLLGSCRLACPWPADPAAFPAGLVVELGWLLPLACLAARELPRLGRAPSWSWARAQEKKSFFLPPTTKGGIFSSLNNKIVRPDSLIS